MPESPTMKTKEQLAKELKTSLDNGLSDKEARLRLRTFGPNQLAEQEKQSLWGLFFKQFEDFMVVVLMITTAISALLGEVVDAVAIMAIILLNAFLGFFQEYRAERSLEALKRLAAPKCRVIRGGHRREIDTKELVPGDILFLQAGDRVPADARLVESNSLSVNEAALTGESEPVEKNADWQTSQEVEIGDQANMLFMGTLVTRGSALALAVRTGMESEIGRIAHMIQDSDYSETPLQRRLAQLGKWLVGACLAIVAAVFAAGVWQGLPVYRMFLVGVSLAVAAIPEGLPAVVTIALAVGVQRLIRCQAIVRQLPAIETLGCATVICSDKTGTLTQNKMTVEGFWLNREWLPFHQERGRQEVMRHADLAHLITIGALCNNSEISVGKNDRIDVSGDPTETALKVAAYWSGLTDQELKKKYKRLREVPFDSARKRMSVAVEGSEGVFSFVKGAPDVILELCTRVRIDGRLQPLTPGLRAAIGRQIDRLGDQALRVLGLAYRQLDTTKPSEQTMESNLVFAGLVGMIDPPRPEARRSILQAKRAGIRTIMVTGDHKRTAAAIARRIGLLSTEEEVMTGREWAALSFRQQRKVVRRISVFARVAPEHKLSIVRALKANGEVVGMTGDGVNDAPAVKEADIGISMGLTGTDVTKEASAMILADDNFQTIIQAIAEGRGIYQNIRKFIRYLLACNAGEVLTMFAATVVGLPLPLVPIQILWINLVTDGLPAVALGVDPRDDDVMDLPPRSPNEGVFSRGLHWKIIFTGVLISLCTIAVFVFALWYYPGELQKARTLAFTTLVAAQMVVVFQCRSEHHSIFDIGLFGNPFLVLAVLLSLGMHILVIYHPWLQSIFGTTALTFDDWLLVAVFSAWSLVLDTAVRLIRRQLRRHFSVFKVG